MYKCKECDIILETRGEATEDGTSLFYQCPKCKNIELHTKQYSHGGGLRLTYP
ncbi:MAG: hypothetical protein NWE93_11265 [Candidatus Bathyarchaeota archaeon]|nr:hypothetical protein [Candidatus Bathyarchaeota archaeon]